MRRILWLAVLGCLGGCSNAPIAGFLDTVSPGNRGGTGLGHGHGHPHKDPGPGPVVPDVRPPGSGGGGVEPLPPPAGVGSPFGGGS
jgi:hypothetical protein